MKWPKEQVTILRNAFEQVIENTGLSIQEVREKAQSSPMPILWQIYRVASYDLQYDDTHPSYVNGRGRLADFNPDFVIYPQGCNDDHLKTAIKHIGKVIGIVE